METDPLSDFLRLLRVNANVYLHAHFCGNWAVDVADHKKMPFHVIGAGNCWLHFPDDRSATPLSAGDIIVFPHDSPHSLGDEPQRPGPKTLRNQPAERRPEGRAYTTLLCGDFDIERRFWNPLLDALPDFILIQRGDATGTIHLAALLEMIVAEAAAAEPGSKAIVDKLGETLFVHVLRTHLHRNTDVEAGYAFALGDRMVGKALQAIHRNPESKWSVASLAQIAGQSRSAFAERFQTVVGMPPMQYVTRWRMRQAHEWLVTGKESVGQVAARCGYESEAAFARAFKDLVGVGPGAVRREGDGRRHAIEHEG